MGWVLFSAVHKNQFDGIRRQFKGMDNIFHGRSLLDLKQVCIFRQIGCQGGKQFEGYRNLCQDLPLSFLDISG